MFLSSPGRGRTKIQALFPLWSSKEKEGMRVQAHVSKLWQQRGEARWEGRWDEKRRDRSGAGGDKCLDCVFRDNSYNGRHPYYTEAVKATVFKWSLLYFTYETCFATRLLFKIQSTAQLHLLKWSHSWINTSLTLFKQKLNTVMFTKRRILQNIILQHVQSKRH